MTLWHLINGKANSLKLAVKPPLRSCILLHQPHQEGASILSIQGVVIHVLQTDHELGVGGERGWNADKFNPFLHLQFNN